ncbi:H(+)/Cl(-) exchange transporter 5 isoform X1 [Arapaima gigas]
MRPVNSTPENEISPGESIAENAMFGSSIGDRLHALDSLVSSVGGFTFRSVAKRMENAGFCNESFNSLQSGTSDEDMVEIAGATLDFSSTDDVPPLDRDYVSGTRNGLKGLGSQLFYLTTVAFYCLLREP